MDSGNKQQNKENMKYIYGEKNDFAESIVVFCKINGRYMSDLQKKKFYQEIFDKMSNGYHVDANFLEPFRVELFKRIDTKRW